MSTTTASEMPADLLAEIEAQKSGSGPLTVSERVELHELETILETRGRLGLLSSARLAHLKSRA